MICSDCSYVSGEFFAGQGYSRGLPGMHTAKYEEQDSKDNGSDFVRSVVPDTVFNYAITLVRSVIVYAL